MKLVEFEQVAGNPYFWLYYLSVCFPLAFDEEEEMTLADFIYENYDCDGEAAAWVDAFVQFSEEIMQAHDGHAEDPTTVVVKAAAEEYAVQFHPGDTIFFRNGQEIGSTGPNYDVQKLSFSAFVRLYQAIGFASALVLPMVCVKEAESEQAAVLIRSLLSRMQLEEEHLDLVTDMIVAGLQQ